MPFVFCDEVLEVAVGFFERIDLDLFAAFDLAC
jgi:hypothetical protein